jgi:hypothetical protein
MDTADIQPRIDAVNTLITSKGLREAQANFRIEGHKLASAGAHWYAGALGHDFRSYGTGQGEPEVVIAQLENWARELPTLDERRKAEFTELLAKTIEIGNEYGIDVEFVNPLTEAMKRLSENALTHQPEQA